MDAYVLDFLKARDVELIPQFRISKTIGLNQNITVRKLPLNNVHPSYESFMMLEIARDLRESICQIFETSVAEGDPKFTSLPSVPYEVLHIYLHKHISYVIFFCRFEIVYIKRISSFKYVIMPPPLASRWDHN
jgi:hypothetical protein